tara:strand:+ start:347 stop:1243 length:897 start_codon:yes stop_codon:yes gene_type:complete
MITFTNLGHYGRLGNQMFQYATLYSIAKKNNYDFAIPSDNLNVIDSSYNPVIDKNDYMYLQLFECFNVTGKTLKSSDINYNKIFDHGKNYAKYSPEVFNISDGTNIKGFFQSYKYFQEFEEDIKKEFMFKSEIEKKVFEYFEKLKLKYNVDTITGLHIRLGDVKHEKGDRLVFLNKNYYQKCMKQFDNDRNLFIIFTDDIEWCLQNIKSDKMVISDYSSYEENDIKFEYLDLCAMTHCDNLIMACSSYSWWGAWLNKKNGTIVVPDKWFGPRYSDRTENDLRHPSWIQIKAESNYALK